MDERVARLQTVKDCDTFTENARRLGEQKLADQARMRAVQLRAQAHGAKSDAERECLEAIYAYEEALSKKNGRRTRASRTWQMLRRHGIIAAVERVVNRETDAAGYAVLVEMGLEDYSFEAIVLRHANLFSTNTVERARGRLADHQN